MTQAGLNPKLFLLDIGIGIGKRVHRASHGKQFKTLWALLGRLPRLHSAVVVRKQPPTTCNWGGWV